HRRAPPPVGGAPRGGHHRRRAGGRRPARPPLGPPRRPHRPPDLAGASAAGAVPAGARRSGDETPPRVGHPHPPRRIGLAIVSCAVIALAAAPWWADRASLRLLSEIYAYVALASLWNLLAGYAGLVSVGQHAYVGLGAYILFALAMLADVHPLVAIP